MRLCIGMCVALPMGAELAGWMHLAVAAKAGLSLIVGIVILLCSLGLISDFPLTILLSCALALILQPGFQAGGFDSVGSMKVAFFGMIYGFVFSLLSWRWRYPIGGLVTWTIVIASTNLAGDSSLVRSIGMEVERVFDRGGALLGLPISAVVMYASYEVGWLFNCFSKNQSSLVRASARSTGPSLYKSEKY